MLFLRRRGAGVFLVIAITLLSSKAGASMLALFRDERQAQRHCPADTVVWLDFSKGKYYLPHHKLYGSGFHGSFACRREARRSLYPRSLLGLR